MFEVTYSPGTCVYASDDAVDHADDVPHQVVVSADGTDTLSVMLDGVLYVECTDSAYATIPEYAVSGRLKAFTESYMEQCVNTANGEVKLINLATGASSFEDCSASNTDNAARAACVVALDTGDANVMCVGTA
jgi:hypothetical protein